MSNPFFSFKQFTVYHDRCAMKVGTDGVLLGAWTDLSASRHILDIGTGTGLIALMMAQRSPEAQITAIDLDAEAVSQARDNIQHSPWKDRIEALLQDVCTYSIDKKFDTIVSNPPYLTAEEMSELQEEVRHEPALALDGGMDGLKFYRVIACLWKSILKTGGLMAFEIGYRQGEDVAEILRKSGFSDVRIIKDLGGNDRVVTGIKGEE